MGKHPGYTYRLRDDVAKEAIAELDVQRDTNRKFHRAVEEWADEIAEELGLVGWARRRPRLQIPVPFDPDEHENRSLDPERPHELWIEVMQRSSGKPFLRALRGLPHIHPDDYPGEDANWPPSEERRSLIPAGWYRYAADGEVRVHAGGRTKSAKDARERQASIQKIAPEHPRDIVMRVATVPRNFLSYPGMNVGDGVVLMNDASEISVKDGDEYRPARAGDRVEPIALSEYLEISAQIAREREAKEAAA